MAPHRKALVRCDATRLVPRERTGSRAPAGLVLEIDVGERRAVVVTNNKGCLVDFFNVPRSREAALLHFIRHSKVVASLIGRLPCAGVLLFAPLLQGPEHFGDFLSFGGTQINQL